MTAPAPLYVSDAELAEIVLGPDAAIWKRIVGRLEDDGLPQPDPLVNHRRYLPACLSFFEDRANPRKRSARRRQEANDRLHVRIVPPRRDGVERFK